jgi:hypothetical protein
MVSFPTLPLGASFLGSVNAGPLSKHFQREVRVALRGLGGLSCLKLRYKGKSFRWHRRKGALVLRFGYAHLVRLAALPGLR